MPRTNEDRINFIQGSLTLFIWAAVGILIFYACLLE